MPYMLRVLAGSLLAFALLTAPAAAQYPNKPITVIVPFAAGGPTDVVARLVGEHMSRTLGQTIIVENVGGAGGTLGMTRAAQAQPDGYTIAVGNMGTQSAAPALYPPSNTIRQRASHRLASSITRRRRSSPRRAWRPAT